MIAVEKIAKIMGFKKFLIRSITDLNRVVAEGLPKSALRSCVQHIVSSSSEQRKIMYKIVPQATYKRRKLQLKPTESERTERLARAFATAEYVFNSRDDAEKFFMTPHPELDKQTPAQAALSELGARQIEELLWKIFHGLPA